MKMKPILASLAALAVLPLAAGTFVSPTYYRMVLTDNADHTGLCQISRLFLYDADANAVNLGLTAVAVGTAAKDLQPGEVTWPVAYASPDNSPAILFVDDGSKWCFANGNGGIGNNSIGDGTYEFSFRLADGANPAVSYNFCSANDDEAYTGRALTAWTLYGSLDGETWYVVDERSSVTPVAANYTWYNDGVAFPIERIPDGELETSLSWTRNADGSFTVTAENLKGRTLYALYGGSDPGSDASPAEWDHYEAVGTIAGWTDTIVVPQPAGWGQSVLAIRFAVFDLPFASAVESVASASANLVSLNYYPTSATRIQMKFRLTVEAGNSFFGTVGAQDNNDFRVFGYGGSVYFDYPSDNRMSVAYAKDEALNWEFGNYYIRDLDSGTDLANGGEKTFSGYSSPLQLFGNSGDYGVLHSLKIYEGETLKLDLNPVRLADGTGALYDTVDGRVYESSGELLCGADDPDGINPFLCTGGYGAVSPALVLDSMYIPDDPAVTGSAESGWTLSFDLTAGTGSLVAKYSDGSVTLTQAIADSATGPTNVSTAVTAALAANRTYTLVVDADNGVTPVARTGRTFYTGALAVEKVADGAMASLSSPTFRISRADSHADLTVCYTLNGVACTNVIPDGATFVDIRSTLAYDASATEPVVSTLTLAEGDYGLPAERSATGVTAPFSLPIDRDYSRFFDIVLAHVASGEVLENFPVLVRIGAATVSEFSPSSIASADGADLKFVDWFGNTLSYEVDTWDPSGESCVWVKVPKLYPNQKIRCFYGRDGQSLAAASGVWTDANYFGVWHMNGAVGNGDVADSTGEGRTMTAAAGAAGDTSLMTVVAGVVGVARNSGHEKTVKDGNYFSIPKYSAGSVFTASGWFRLNSSDSVSSARLFSRKTNYDQDYGWEIEFGSRATRVVARARQNMNIDMDGMPDLSTGWHYLSFVYDDDVLFGYVDGELFKSGTVLPATDPDLPLALGNNANGTENAFGGGFDEIRLRASASSAAWIREEFATMGESYLQYGRSIPTGADTVADPDPVAQLWSVDEIGRSSFVADWSLDYLGAAEGVSFVCQYGETAEALTNETVSAAVFSALGTYRTTVDGFMPGRTYFVRFAVRYGETTSAFSQVAALTTESEPAMKRIPSQVGLWQRKVTHGYEPDSGFDQDVFAVAAGSGEWERHAELGPVMGYTTAGYESEFSGLSSWWTASYQAFLYAGYMYLEAGDYTFGTAQDDTAYIEIDGVPVHNITHFTNGAVTEWTCATAGWHAVKLGVGDYGGNRGPISKSYMDVNAFYYRFNGGDKTYFLDPGDGTLFALTLEPGFTPTSIGRVDGPESTSVSVTCRLDASLEGGAVYAVYGRTYGGDVRADWSASASLGTLAAGDTNLVSLVRDIPADARYFRLVVEKDGVSYWGTTLSLAEMDGAVLPPPAFEGPFVTSVTGESARVSLKMLFLGGDGSAEALVTAKLVGTLETNEFVTVVSDLALGSNEFVLAGLRPNRRYVFTLVARNADAESEPSAAVEFTTPANDSASFTAGEPGLWQRKVTHGGEPDSGFDQDVFAADAGIGEWQRHVELGPVMAYDQNSYYSEFSRLTTAWTDSYQAFLYAGYMYLEAGDYRIVSSQDDTAYFEIGGVAIHNITKYTAGATTDWTCPETGWYAVKIGVGDYTGSRGPMHGEGSIEGFYYIFNGDGVKHRLLDPGDGSLFRTQPPVRYVKNLTYGIADGTLTARMTMSEPVDGRDVTVTAYAGSGDGGCDTSAWASSETVGSYGSSVSNVTYVTSDGVATTKRYFAFDITAPNVPDAWSPSCYLPDPARPQLSEKATGDFTLGDTVVIGGFVVAAGGAADSTVAVRVELGLCEDLSDAVAYPVGDLKSGEAFSRRIPSGDEAALAASTNYYWRVVAERADGVCDVTPVASDYLEGPSVLSATMQSSDNGFVGSFIGGLDKIGAGNEATVTLWTGSSPETLTNTASLVLNEAKGFSFDSEFQRANETVYYKFSVSNACPSASWTSETPVASLYLRERLTYRWAGGSEGRWTDPANWIPSDPRGTYPASEFTTVVFDTFANGAATVDYDGAESVKIYQLSVSNGDLELKGCGQTLQMSEWDATLLLGAGCTLTLDNLSLPTGSYYRPNLGSTLRLKNGAYFCASRETWFHTSATILVESGSTYRQRDWNFQLAAPDGRVTVDNATLWSSNDSFYFGTESSAVTNVLEICGAAPVVKARNFYGYRESDATSPVEIRFTVPSAGYAAAPVQRDSDNDRNAFNANRDKGVHPIRFSIAKKSPAFASGVKTQKLVAWSTGIDTTNVVLDPSPRAGMSEFFWTYGTDDSIEPDGNLPTGLWVRFSNRGSYVILR